MEQFPSCVLFLDGKYALHWNAGNDTVTFGVQVGQTSGWFGLGVSEGGGMKGADSWVFSKNAGGQWTVNDRFSEDYVTPTDDASQDVSISSTSQTANSTTVVFTRKLDTCDIEKDNVIYPQHPQPYIAAFGLGEWGYHGPENRETRFLVLAPNTTSTPKVNTVAAGVDQEEDISFLMPNITVPAQETSYLCTNFEAPRDNKYQIIAGNYSITPNKMVHHMILFACYSKPAAPAGKIYECTATPYECSAMYLVWVPGSEYETMPPGTGFPFGKGSYEYMMLQVHYTNPEGRVGVEDSSGVIATYTSQLRPNDLGVLWLGTEQFAIPPGQEAYAVPPNICPSECTSKFTTDLNLVATEFHMHQTGAKQTVQRLRKESPLANSGAPTGASFQEIIPLNYRNYYDFNWQGTTFILPGGETLMRGETLITTCTYNTVKRTNVTNFGLSSFDEMCYNFVRYWPAQKIDRCITIEGSEVNGTALVTCANQKEFYGYVVEANITDFNESVVEDLIAQGFVIPYNTSQYKDFIPYNRTTSECAATLNNKTLQTVPAPAPPASPTPGNATSAASRSASVVGLREGLMTVASALVLMFAVR